MQPTPERYSVAMLRGALPTHLFVVLLLLAPSVTRAQDCNPSEGEVAEARALFIAASAAVDGGRWADAIDSFERAYSLSCAPSALYNLAMALRALGRHREARDGFDRLMRLHPDLGGELRQSSVQYRAEEAARVAVIELLGVEGLSPQLVFDGSEITDSGARPVIIETDSGNHSLVARIPERQPFVWDGSLSDGQRQAITVIFEEPREVSGFDPVPLIVTIAAVLVAGAAAGVTAFLVDDAQLRPLNADRTVVVGP